MTLTYVYCLVRSARRPSVPDGADAAGVPGGADTRAVSAGEGVWMIATSVPARQYDEAALSRQVADLDWVAPRALGHERIIELFLGARAVLPMQLFTLFTSDDRALDHVRRQREEIDEVLERLDRKLEFGVRLSFDEAAARELAAAREHEPASRSASTRGVRAAAGAVGPDARPASGMSYLTRKRDLLGAARGQAAAARAEADALFEGLSAVATAARRRRSTEKAVGGSRILLDAAFLVSKAQAARFKRTLRDHMRSDAAAGLDLSLTGPWPPYNFITAPQPRADGRRTTSKR